MESSASSAPHYAEESEPEQVRSDLHALKALYGLLHKRENDPENTYRDSEDWLDDKSRAFLVKLLDEATQRALRRQAKMLSCAVLSPSLNLTQRRRLDRASEPAGEEAAIMDYHRKCHQSEKESSAVEASTSQNPGPSREGLRLLKRLESRRPVLSRDGSKHGHDRPIRRDLDGAGIDRSSETRKNADHVITHADELTRQPDLRPTIAKPHRRSHTKHAAVATGYNSGEPAHKRSRLESEDGRPGRTPSRARTERRTEHESTRVKSSRFPKEPRVKERAELNVAMHVLRRSGSLKSGRLEEPGYPDLRVQISQPKKRADQGKAEGKEIIRSSSRRSRLATPEKPPSHEEVPVDRVKTSHELGRPSSRLVDKQNGSTTDRVGPSRTKRPPINPSKMRSNKARRSSSSGSTTRSSDSGSSPGTTSTTESHSLTRSVHGRAAGASASTRNSEHRGDQVRRRAMGRPTAARRHPAAPSRAAPTGRHISEERRPRRPRPPEAADANRQKKPADQREGRLSRLRNKLAIVFHHQHHHHHHHHHHRPQGHADGDSSSQDEDGAHRREHHHERSPWRYLRRILHRAGDEEDDRGRGRNLVTEVRGERAAEKVVPAHHQHGHVRALFEALLRHVWGTRTRPRKPVRASRPGVGRSASRVRLRKLHWWQGCGDKVA